MANSCLTPLSPLTKFLLFHFHSANWCASAIRLHRFKSAYNGITKASFAKLVSILKSCQRYLQLAGSQCWLWCESNHLPLYQQLPLQDPTTLLFPPPARLIGQLWSLQRKFQNLDCTLCSSAEILKFLWLFQNLDCSKPKDFWPFWSWAGSNFFW